MRKYRHNVRHGSSRAIALFPSAPYCELVIHPFALARQITNTLLALPEFQQSTNVSCFLSMPTGEVDTSAVVSAILGAGARIGFAPSLSRLRMLTAAVHAPMTHTYVLPDRQEALHP